MKMTSLTDLKALDEWTKKFIESHRDGAICGLTGALGAGKTTLVRSVIAHLSKDKKRPAREESFVCSSSELPGAHPPSGALRPLSSGKGDRKLILLEMGYFEALERTQTSKGFLFVEWPERVEDSSILCLTIQIHLEIKDCDGRTLKQS